MSKGRDERRRRGRFGRFAESICVWHLRARGFRVLARRYRAPMGEIDIIARRGRLVAFIEVKARRSFDLAGESLSVHQRRRIVRAAAAFLQKTPRLQGLDQRFDVMLVAPWRPPRHLIGAWRQDD
jgi:putative endonuclease